MRVRVRVRVRVRGRGGGAPDRASAAPGGVRALPAEPGAFTGGELAEARSAIARGVRARRGEEQAAGAPAGRRAQHPDPLERAAA
ncbi:hypothetical protein DDQ41_13355 [Streptomyces spongiicola]|uniref:Uncharacterized protein n=1 Tax=Streptomyces spongiicola TaxID=1690221 RepID=A0ABN5KN21_9ACTN|nr:hypothetical protein DDQ41_13355 [Streptomyces spongiicola]